MPLLIAVGTIHEIDGSYVEPVRTDFPATAVAGLGTWPYNDFVGRQWQYFVSFGFFKSCCRGICELEQIGK